MLLQCSVFQEYNFHVCWPTVKLITLLLANRTKEIQKIILANPMGVSKIMDLLSDSKEIIRNDVNIPRWSLNELVIPCVLFKTWIRYSRYPYQVQSQVQADT